MDEVQKQKTIRILGTFFVEQTVVEEKGHCRKFLEHVIFA
jgi:hypothetical protein